MTPTTGRRSVVLPLLAALAFVSESETQASPMPSPSLARPFGPATDAVFLQGRARAFRLLVGSHLCLESPLQREFRSLTDRLERATNGLEKRFPGVDFGLVQDGHNPVQPPLDCGDDARVAGMLAEYRDIVAQVETMEATPEEPK